MYLTKQKIIQIAKKAPQLKGSIIDWDEDGRAIITLAKNMTWDAQDGNRTVESFIYEEEWACEPRDTIEYFKERLSMVTPII